MPIPIAISISKETFDLVATYFTDGHYPPSPPERSHRSSTNKRKRLRIEGPDLVQHTNVYDAASSLGTPRLQELAMAAFADDLGTCEQNMQLYIDSLDIIYKPGFGAAESKPSTPGPPQRDTMKWCATHGFIEYLPRLYFRNEQAWRLRRFCHSEGEYCYDMMAAIVASERVKGKPITNLIKHQIKTFAFKTLCCNDSRFAFGTLKRVLSALPCPWTGETYEGSEDD